MAPEGTGLLTVFRQSPNHHEGRRLDEAPDFVIFYQI
jgi:hypothetical protein